MKNSEANPTATILREIADVLDAGGDPAEEFEQCCDGHLWHMPSDKQDLFDSVADPYWQVRRKPKTVRVSGEVSRNDIHTLLTLMLNCDEAEHEALSALLDCVEDGHD